MSENAAQNGNSAFVVDDLLNMIVPFEFPFEGSVLKGRWYKYRTTAPSYIQGLMAKIRNYRDQVIALTQQVDQVKPSDPQFSVLMEQRDLLEDRLNRSPYDWMADAVVEWNAVGKDREPLTISTEVLDTFPLLFLEKLNGFLAAERRGENPTSPTS